MTQNYSSFYLNHRHYRHEAISFVIIINIIIIIISAKVISCRSEKYTINIWKLSELTTSLISPTLLQRKDEMKRYVYFNSSVSSRCLEPQTEFYEKKIESNSTACYLLFYMDSIITQNYKLRR